MSTMASRWLLKGSQPGQDAFDIAIEDREGPIEGRAQNAARRAAANARDHKPGFKILGPRLALKLLRRLMQPPRPRVIAKALPKQQNLLLIRCSQIINRWKHLHPALPIGQHHLQLGLLQHHFGNPNAVGIRLTGSPRLLPGNAVTAVMIKPIQQQRCKTDTRQTIKRDSRPMLRTSPLLQITKERTAASLSTCM